jgi:hypothetical protein
VLNCRSGLAFNSWREPELSSLRHSRERRNPHFRMGLWIPAGLLSAGVMFFRGNDAIGSERRHRDSPG